MGDRRRKERGHKYIHIVYTTPWHGLRHHKQTIRTLSTYNGLLDVTLHIYLFKIDENERLDTNVIFKQLNDWLKVFII